MQVTPQQDASEEPGQDGHPSGHTPRPKRAVEVLGSPMRALSRALASLNPLRRGPGDKTPGASAPSTPQGRPPRVALPVCSKHGQV